MVGWSFQFRLVYKNQIGGGVTVVYDLESMNKQLTVPRNEESAAQILILEEI